MGHCSGGPSTDRFDFLTPLMAWVEERRAPDTVIASGVNFKTAPAARSRPLCPYPQTLRYTGPDGGDIALAENYTCREWPKKHGGGRRGDDDDDDDGD
jgi:feruloyl esterase